MGFKKAAILFPSLIALGVLYLIYTSFYPTDSFYKEDFEFITKIELPKSANIITKDANYPDIHGKYSSVAVVKLSINDYNVLLDRIKKDSSFTPQSHIGTGSIYHEITSGIDQKEIIKIFRKKKMIIAFLNDNSRIILERQISDY